MYTDETLTANPHPPATPLGGRARQVDAFEDPGMWQSYPQPGALAAVEGWLEVRAREEGWAAQTRKIKRWMWLKFQRWLHESARVRLHQVHAEHVRAFFAAQVPTAKAQRRRYVVL